MKAMKALATACLMSAALMTNTLAFAADHRDTGRGTGPIIFVTSQGLYFDSIVVADPLPMKGRFQQLVPGMNGLSTEFGPGEPGHLGGRWWVDLNEDGIMDPEDHFFLCPLLGPGREAP
jgi:hypothetical protein